MSKTPEQQARDILKEQKDPFLLIMDDIYQIYRGIARRTGYRPNLRVFIHPKVFHIMMTSPKARECLANRRGIEIKDRGRVSLQGHPVYIDPNEPFYRITEE